MEYSEQDGGIGHVRLPHQRRLSQCVARAGVIQPAVHAHQADHEHRHEDQVHADERSPEMHLAEPLVEHAAGDAREPVVDAREQREHRPRCDQVVEVRDHVIGIVQRDITGRETERESGQAADTEHRQERQREQHRRGEPNRPAPQRHHQRRDQDHRRDRDDHRRDLEEQAERRAHAAQEHVMGPHHHRHAAHEQHRRHHHPVAPERPPRVDGDHFGNDAHGGQDEDVDLRMRKEPEQVLPQQGIATARRSEQGCTADHQAGRQEEAGAGDPVH